MLFPANFRAPLSADLDGYQLQLLSAEHAEADYRAVMDAAARIRGVFGADNLWPPADLSFEDNLADLVRHQQESLTNISFAYAVRQQADYAGCLYIKPFKSRLEHDRRRGIYRELCYLWVTEAFVAQEAAIYQRCHAWVRAAFPLEGAIWPGRELDWAQWDALATA